MKTRAEMHAYLIGRFADEAEAVGRFAYDSLCMDLVKSQGEDEFDRLNFAENIGFAVRGLADSLAARLRFELLDWVSPPLTCSTNQDTGSGNRGSSDA